MKRICLLAVFFISFISKGLGQYVPMLNDSTVWRQGIMSCYLNGMTVECSGWDYYNFSIDNSNDTLIGGKNYTLIKDKNNNFEYAFIREDSGKVYMKYPAYVFLPRYTQELLSSNIYLDTTEFLLYDFTLQVGDTFTTRMFHCKYEVEWGIHLSLLNRF
ncbi:MAG: hypothetical protein M0D57_06820 [Sphingobacteriales bacterium JAD_PAG50586_3]|nr:MAG: hypothetical protein M0D57_06820 [Sphingobacteriales bacterium JAD_PAG50586_3]